MLDTSQYKKIKTAKLETTEKFKVHHDVENGIVQVTFYTSRCGRYVIELYHDTELNNETIQNEMWKNHPVVLWIDEEIVYCPSVEIAFTIVNGLNKL